MGIPLQNGIAQEITLISGQSLAAFFTSNPFDIRFFQLGSLQIEWAGNNANDGAFRVQVSVDQSCWCDLLPAASWATTSLTDNCAFYALDIMPFPYLRMYYTPGANTTGTFSVKGFFKKMNTGGQY